MLTYSHFLTTALLGDVLKRRTRVRLAPLLAGSVLPDVPILLLTLGWFVYRGWFDPLAPGEHIYGPRYDTLFFENPVWVVSHNLLHAPFVIAGIVVVGMWWRRKEPAQGSMLVWFGLGCLLHTSADVLTHVEDGPLVLFPVDWHTRIVGFVSYWDPSYGASTVRRVEALVDLAIASYFVVLWIRRRFPRRLTRSP